MTFWSDRHHKQYIDTLSLDSGQKLGNRFGDQRCNVVDIAEAVVCLAILSTGLFIQDSVPVKGNISWQGWFLKRGTRLRDINYVTALIF